MTISVVMLFSNDIKSSDITDIVISNSFSSYSNRQKGGVKELKMKTKTATAIKAVAGKMAKISCNAASIWGMYQPKEPKMKK